MDIYLNMKAFQFTASTGNFSAAARMLGVAPSVVTKRVNQLEAQLDSKLFNRSTRSVTLTEVGRRYLERSKSITTQIEELVQHQRHPGELEDFLRIKAPTTMTQLHLQDVFQDFLLQHPKVRIELVLMDRAVDPASEQFDLAIGAFPQSFGDATDEPLCKLRRLLCAAPAYLAENSIPQHPKDLVRHHCLSFVPTGHNWVFLSDRGPTTIDIAPRFSANDGQAVVAAAAAGFGIAIVSQYAVQHLLDDGTLVPVLEEFTLPDMWIKAVAPDSRRESPAVRSLVGHLRNRLAPIPPWERS